MAKLGLVLIATLCLLWNQVLSNEGSNGEFLSLLKTKVEGAITPPFRINGPNGLCAYAHNYNELRVRPCGSVDLAERYTFHDDGTLRVNGKCLTARAFTQGALVQPDTCSNSNRNAITWQLQITGRQIVHPSSGLVLSALNAVDWSTMTLEANVFSWYQTFRFDYHTPVPTGHIIGMNGLCLVYSNNEVWLDVCGTSLSQKWRVYPDGTIRSQQRTNGCLSFDNFTNGRVLVTTCGLAASSERWVLTQNSTIWNEGANLVLDVAGADPSQRRIVVYRHTGGANQRFRIFYD